MSVTDEIYGELMDGLRTGLDYDPIRLKWEGSKGPFYNALQRVLSDAGTEITRLSSELAALHRKTTEAEAHLAELDDHQRQAEDAAEVKKKGVKSLEEKECAVKGQVEELEGNLTTKGELLKQLRELEGTGFGIGELRQLRDTLADIGSSQGLKPVEAVNRFISDMKDYDTKVGFELELRRLQVVTDTQKMEAEKWQAEREAMERKNRDAREVIGAMESLLKQGVKPVEIVSWNKVIAKVGGVKELKGELHHYRSVKEAVAAGTHEVKALNLTRERLNGEVTGLKEQGAHLEGSIEAVSAHGTKAIDAARDKATSTFAAAIDQFRNDAMKLAELKAEAGRMEKELSYARYLTADSEVLKRAPAQVAHVFLEAVARCFEVKAFNPPVSPAPSVSGRYSYISPGFDGVGISELMTRIRATLVEYEGIWDKFQ